VRVQRSKRESSLEKFVVYSHNRGPNVFLFLFHSLPARPPTLHFFFFCGRFIAI